MIDRVVLVLYVIWRAALVTLVFVGWVLGMIAGTFVGGIASGFLRGYKG
jgi:hypothetical protein